MPPLLPLLPLPLPLPLRLPLPLLLPLPPLPGREGGARAQGRGLGVKNIT